MSTATTSASVEAQLRTRAFARVVGPYIATFTLLYAFRLPEQLWLIEALFAEPVLVFMLGALMIGGGLVIIGGHRSWRGPVAITVSLLGWFIAVRGFLLVASPGALESTVDATMLSPTAMTVSRVFFGLLAAVGLWLTCAGWFGRPVTAVPAVTTTATA